MPKSARRAMGPRMVTCAWSLVMTSLIALMDGPGFVVLELLGEAPPVVCLILSWMKERSVSVRTAAAAWLGFREGGVSAGLGSDWGDGVAGGFGVGTCGYFK